MKRNKTRHKIRKPVKVPLMKETLIINLFLLLYYILSRLIRTCTLRLNKTITSVSALTCIAKVNISVGAIMVRLITWCCYKTLSMSTTNCTLIRWVFEYLTWNTDNPKWIEHCRWETQNNKTIAIHKLKRFCLMVKTSQILCSGETESS